MKFLNKGSGNSVTIKVDGVSLDDYSHFIDYRRGYAYGFAALAMDTNAQAIRNLSDPDIVVVSYKHIISNTWYDTACAKIAKHTECFDFLTIPFVDSFEVKINNWSYYDYNTTPDKNNNFQVSIAVWENDD